MYVDYQCFLPPSYIFLRFPFGSYHATMHREATKELCKAVVAHGQRAFVGKVCMDRNAVDYYQVP